MRCHGIIVIFGFNIHRFFKTCTQVLPLKPEICYYQNIGSLWPNLLWHCYNGIFEIFEKTEIEIEKLQMIAFRMNCYLFFKNIYYCQSSKNFLVLKFQNISNFIALIHGMPRMSTTLFQTKQSTNYFRFFFNKTKFLSGLKFS